jgi:hypothetical protein
MVITFTINDIVTKFSNQFLKMTILTNTNKTGCRVDGDGTRWDMLKG